MLEYGRFVSVLDEGCVQQVRFIAGEKSLDLTFLLGTSKKRGSRSLEEFLNDHHVERTTKLQKLLHGSGKTDESTLHFIYTHRVFGVYYDPKTKEILEVHLEYIH